METAPDGDVASMSAQIGKDQQSPRLLNRTDTVKLEVIRRVASNAEKVGQYHAVIA